MFQAGHAVVVSINKTGAKNIVAKVQCRRQGIVVIKQGSIVFQSKEATILEIAQALIVVPVELPTSRRNAAMRQFRCVNFWQVAVDSDVLYRNGRTLRFRLKDKDVKVTELVVVPHRVAFRDGDAGALVLGQRVIVAQRIGMPSQALERQAQGVGAVADLSNQAILK